MIDELSVFKPKFDNEPETIAKKTLSARLLYDNLMDRTEYKTGALDGLVDIFLKNQIASMAEKYKETNYEPKLKINVYEKDNVVHLVFHNNGKLQSEYTGEISTRKRSEDFKNIFKSQCSLEEIKEQIKEIKKIGAVAGYEGDKAGQKFYIRVPMRNLK